ncbi:MAG: DUF1015 domain-containing protein [Chitinophagaceae bacterium]
MAILQPFQAIRPVPNLAQKIASLPYDVLSSAEARKLATDNPFSFYHISKAEIDLPQSTDVHDPLVYSKAGENFRLWLKNGYLFKEEHPCLYIYTLVMKGRSQTGLVGASSLDDYDQGIIKKHELTRPDKEMDRICHIQSTGAQTGNVFLTYPDVEELDEVIAIWKSSHLPVYDFTGEDQIRHTVWVIDQEQTLNYITHLFKEQVPFTYIADGHHRAASASLVRKEFLEKNHFVSRDHPIHFFLTTLFPASQLAILDYNRLVRDLNGLDPEAFLSRIDNDFKIIQSANTPVKPDSLHEFGMYLEGKWYRLQAKPATYTQDPIGVLDVTVLQTNILDNVLGIKDPRTDQRIDFIGGIRGLQELADRVDSGQMKVAFSLFPVTIEQLFAIADSGKVMPPKSTWFEPKLRDGLLSHEI